MTADYYDDAKILKLFIRIFNFLIVLIKQVRLQLQTRFWFCKMQFEAYAVYDMTEHIGVNPEGLEVATPQILRWGSWGGRRGS